MRFDPTSSISLSKTAPGGHQPAGHQTAIKKNEPMIIFKNLLIIFMDEQALGQNSLSCIPNRAIVRLQLELYTKSSTSQIAVGAVCRIEHY